MKKKAIPVTLSLGLMMGTIAPTVGFAQEDALSITATAETNDLQLTSTDTDTISATGLQEFNLSKDGVEEWEFINPDLERFESDDRQVMSTLTTGDVANVADLKPLFLQANKEMATTITFTYTGNPKNFKEEFVKMREDVLLEPGNDYLHGVSFGYGYRFAGNQVTVTLSYMSNPEQEKKVDERIKEVAKEIFKDGMTDLEKVKAANDWIVTNTTYSKSTKASKHSLYALLFEGKGVCQAYAVAAYRLLTEGGMEARYVFGHAGESHTWNLVKVDGKWYKLDTTWNDPLKQTDYATNSYNYFLITSEQLKKSHKWAEDKYPVADDGKYNYFREIGSSVTVGDDIYYANYGDGSSLNKVNYKTGAKTKLSNLRGNYLAQYNDVIYFANYNNQGYLSSYNIASGEVKALENVEAKNIYIKDYELHYKKGSKKLTYDLPLTETDEILHGVKKGFNGLNPKSKTYIESIVTARKYYDLLTEDLKSMVSASQYKQLTDVEESTKAAQGVWKIIEAMAVSKDTASIVLAREAYDALSKTDRKLISNVKTLTTAEKSVKAVLKAIKAIDTIDPAAGKKFISQVKAARKAYDKTGDLKDQVYNAEEFVKIEKQALVYEKISKLKLTNGKLIALATAANEAYEELPSSDTALVTNKDLLDSALKAIAPAVKVVGEIATLDTVTLNIEAIQAARKSYDALSKQEKKYVNNVKVLTGLEKKLKNTLKVIDMIKALNENDAKFAAQVAKVRAAYDKLPADQKALVSNIDTLTQFEAKLKGDS